MEVFVNLAVNREGQLRAAAAAALWPDTNIELPTNTFNSYRTRLRAFIKDKTNGAITELVRDNEDGTCQLDPNLIQVDYWDFLDAIDPDNTGARAGTSLPQRCQKLSRLARPEHRRRVDHRGSRPGASRRAQSRPRPSARPHPQP